MGRKCSLWGNHLRLGGRQNTVSKEPKGQGKNSTEISTKEKSEQRYMDYSQRSGVIKDRFVSREP